MSTSFDGRNPEGSWDQYVSEIPLSNLPGGRGLNDLWLRLLGRAIPRGPSRSRDNRAARDILDAYVHDWENPGHAYGLGQHPFPTPGERWPAPKKPSGNLFDDPDRQAEIDDIMTAWDPNNKGPESSKPSGNLFDDPARQAEIDDIMEYWGDPDWKPPGSGERKPDTGRNPTNWDYIQPNYPVPPVIPPFSLGMPPVPSPLRHLYPNGTGFPTSGGGGFSPYGGYGGYAGYGPTPHIGPPNRQVNPDGTYRRDDPNFWDNISTPWGRRTVERSVPGYGQRMQGRWRADNRPPFGWVNEMRDRGHRVQYGDNRTGKKRFDPWGIISGALRGVGKNIGEGRNSGANIGRGIIANLLKERYLW